MEAIAVDKVQSALDQYANHDVYVHLETTNGAYATHSGESKMNVGAYIRNTLIRFTRGVIAGSGPYRIGLKMENGWVYAEGITDWEIDSDKRLLLAGHDDQGRLAVALELSHEPFRM